MLLSDVLLAFSAIASIVSFYYYSKEKKILREFIQQSRRHSHHKNLDIAMQKKASRYLILSIAFFLIAIPLLVQKFIELY